MSGSGDFISREEACAVMPDDYYGWRDKKLLKSIPAADVRPVVTCGECKYWELSKIEPLYHVCTYLCGVTFVREAEDFCSRGEKREES